MHTNFKEYHRKKEINSAHTPLHLAFFKTIRNIAEYLGALD